MFQKTILGNVDVCRTECEISDEEANVVAVVYEVFDGWHIDILRDLHAEELEEFNANVAAAKESLSHYVNRTGHNPPDGVTVAGLSFWLMERDDGTCLGLNLADSGSASSSAMLTDIPPEMEQKLQSLMRSGRYIEATRELRVITGCSLKQAKEWLSGRNW